MCLLSCVAVTRHGWQAKEPPAAPLDGPAELVDVDEPGDDASRGEPVDPVGMMALHQACAILPSWRALISPHSSSRFSIPTRRANSSACSCMFILEMYHKCVEYPVV